MNRILALLLILPLALLSSALAAGDGAAAATDEPPASVPTVTRSSKLAGTLVIVGGGLSADNAAVYRAFIDALPNSEDDRIAILPSASGEPARSAASFVRALGRHGFPADRVDVVKLALRDDPSTAAIDEAAWRGNGNSPTEIRKIEAAGGIWMTGGDQRRIVELLAPGSDGQTPMLAALRARLEAGAVIGGTSAGAAVMSDPMITGGDPLASLTRRAGEERSDALTLGRGLGFLPGSLVDQHFGARARLGRLALALAARVPAERLGFGVDEDTALIVDRAQGVIRVAGAGTVTLLDGREASFSTVDDQFAAFDFALSVLSPGDHYGSDGKITIDPSRKATVGNEYFDRPAPAGSGMAVPQPPVGRLLGEALLDNEASKTLTRVSFQDDGRAVVYRFEQTDGSAGYWGRDAADRGRYSIERVRFDILPARVTVALPTPGKGP